MPKKVCVSVLFSKLIFLFAFAVLICASCSSEKLPVKNLVIQTADGNEIILKVEIAKTEEQRNKGFMNRKSIPDGTGMLFVFESDRILSFWMKNTPHPLSIAYIDRSGKIRNIFDMKPFSLSDVKSTVSVRYALEVPRGWFEKVGIKIGDRVSDIETF